jgi:hypothetical protein
MPIKAFGNWGDESLVGAHFPLFTVYFPRKLSGKKMPLQSGVEMSVSKYFFYKKNIEFLLYNLLLILLGFEIVVKIELFS